MGRRTRTKYEQDWPPPPDDDDDDEGDAASEDEGENTSSNNNNNQSDSNQQQQEEEEEEEEDQEEGSRCNVCDHLDSDHYENFCPDPINGEICGGRIYWCNVCESDCVICTKIHDDEDIRPK